MQAERDYLIKFTFPRLRKLCESRAVTWGEVDLRWGVTDEENAEGRMLSLCLEEINRCRPYFIGILGERYGWIPENVSAELVAREGWLQAQLEQRKSVAELEIRHGVLNNPELAKYAFFYFRDPDYINTIPRAQRSDFLSKDPESLGKLNELKQLIRAGKFPVRENYADPKELGDLILEDFTGLIDSIFPVDTEPDLLDREAWDHEAFARSRATVYVGGTQYFERLDEYVHSGGPPLLVLGESGSGKSALLANWFLRYRQLHPESFALIHFIGATANSADLYYLLRRIMQEIKHRSPHRIHDDVPLLPQAIRAEFPSWLARTPNDEKIVLLLDGLNQLDNRDAAAELGWLPTGFPSNCRVILSTLAGPAREAMRRRECQELTLAPLSVAERQLLLENLLKHYGRHLSAERVEKITSADQTATPLFLCAMLDELRQFGEHEHLGERIDYYLSVSSPQALYEKILERWEQDYEYDRPGLVRQAMSALWAARSGLSETDLLHLLRRPGEERLPQAIWSPLFLAAEHALVSRSGLLSFSHDYLNRAVAEKYLYQRRFRDESHRRVIDYFNSQSLSVRKVDELPWQLRANEDWQGLVALLTDPSFLLVAWLRDAYAVRGYWSSIEANSDYRLEDWYQQLINIRADFNPAVEAVVSQLLESAGRRAEALVLAKKRLAKAYRGRDQRELAEALLKTGSILISLGNFDEAEQYLEESASLFKTIGVVNGRAAALGNVALILDRCGRLAEAMSIHQQVAHIYESINDLEGLLVALNNQAGILYRQGEWPVALQLYQEIEIRAKESGLTEATQRAIANQGVVYQSLGQAEVALDLFRRAEAVCREFGLMHGLQRALGNQAKIHRNNGRLDQARQLVEEQEDLCRVLDDPFELSVCLGLKAQVLEAQGKFEEALEVLTARLETLRRLKLKNEIVAVLAHQAAIHLRFNRVEEYERLLQEAEAYE